MALHGAYDGDLIHLLRKLREELPGKIEIVAHLPDVQILRRAFALLEVEGVDVADRPREFNDDRIACAAPRIRLAGGPRLHRPKHLVCKSPKNAVAADLQKIAACGK